MCICMHICACIHLDHSRRRRITINMIYYISLSFLSRPYPRFIFFFNILLIIYRVLYLNYSRETSIHPFRLHEQKDCPDFGRNGNPNNEIGILYLFTFQTSLSVCFLDGYSSPSKNNEVISKDRKLNETLPSCY